MTSELKARCDSIEDCYELMLTYAGQGLTDDRGSKAGGQLRPSLRRCDEALTGLADLLAQLVETENLQPADHYKAFIAVLDRDACAAQAAMRLVIAQPAISSQLVDNLNASIHVRALLTDLFLIDEIVTARAVAPPAWNEQDR